jgi:beta-lactamase class A
MGQRVIRAPLSLLLLASAAAAAPSPDSSGLPVAVADEDFRPLYAWVDAGLDKTLKQRLEARPEWRRLIRAKKLAVGLVDLSDPARPRFARVNGNTMMYAASLPKIAILLAAYQSIEDGLLSETPEIQADLTAMIRTSDNAAATAMIDRLGFERIAEVVTDPRYQLYDKSLGGGLWVGKRYAKSGRRIGDPLLNISHAATVTQVCRFYYLLATGRVVSFERSRQMLGDLSNPGLHHKFVGVLEKRAPRARLFRKSGSWRQWHSDSALVWGPEWRRYILVGMIEGGDGEEVLRSLVPVIEQLLRDLPPPV